MLNPTLPAEWHPQSHVIITWPHPESDWHAILHNIEPAYIAFAKAILITTPLMVICQTPQIAKNVQAHCDHPNLSTLIQSTNDTWVRNYGPMSIIDNRQISLLDFQFNGWGQKYQHDLDNKLNRALFQHQCFSPYATKKKQLILEGGSIDSNGQGLLLTTESCLSKRNTLSKNNYGEIFKSLFGIKSCCWIPEGFLLGDDTDGHVDNLARFISEHQIVYHTCSQKDVHYPYFQAMEKALQMWAKSYEQLELIPIPLPEPIFLNQTRLPASHINFLITNEQIIVPIFNQKHDQEILTLFKSLRPDYLITPLDANAFIQQGGGPHCASMQIPSLG